MHTMPLSIHRPAPLQYSGKKDTQQRQQESNTAPARPASPTFQGQTPKQSVNPDTLFPTFQQFMAAYMPPPDRQIRSFAEEVVMSNTLDPQDRRTKLIRSLSQLTGAVEDITEGHTKGIGTVLMDIQLTFEDLAQTTEGEDVETLFTHLATAAETLKKPQNLQGVEWIEIEQHLFPLQGSPHFSDEEYQAVQTTMRGLMQLCREYEGAKKK